MRQKKYLVISALPFLLLSAPALAQETAPTEGDEKEEKPAEDDSNKEDSPADEETTDKEKPADEGADSEDSSEDSPSEKSEAPLDAAEEKGDSDQADAEKAEAVSADVQVKEDEEVETISAPAPVAPQEKKTSHKDPEPEPREEADEEAVEEAAAAALTDTPDEGPSLTPLKVTTSVWSRLEVRENYDRLGVSRGRFLEGDRTFFRARLGLETNPLAIDDTSDVAVKIAPQASGTWGSNDVTNAASAGLFEGYLRLRTKRVDFQMGRFAMAYGNEQLIGGLGWHQNARAFDGLRFHYKMDHGYLDLFATQIREGSAFADRSLLGSDRYFWGAYAGLGDYVKDGLELDLYFLGLSQRTQDIEWGGEQHFSSEGSTFFTGGSRIADKTGAIDYRLEAGLQFGTTSVYAENQLPYLSSGTFPNEKVFAYQANGELGFSFGGRTRLSLGGAFASGDDATTTDVEGWNHLFPTGHGFLGLMDVIGGRTNVLSANVKVKQKLTSSLTFKVDGHVFARPEEGGLGSVDDSGMAGTEVDTQLVQKLGKYTHVRGLYGVFIPSSGHYRSDDLVHFAEFQAGLNF